MGSGTKLPSENSATHKAFYPSPMSLTRFVETPRGVDRGENTSLVTPLPKEYSLCVKRIPGTLTLLIVSVMLIFPIVRGMIYDCTHIPADYISLPYSVSVPEAIWFASILCATFSFFVASVLPLTWRSGLGWFLMGVIFLGAGWSGRNKAFQMESSRHLHDTTWNKDPDVPALRAQLEAMIPLKTPLGDAKMRMKSIGFACSEYDDARDPSHLRFGTHSLPPAMKLYCTKQDHWPKHIAVVRRWVVYFEFPPYQFPNPGVTAMFVSCGHYCWRIFLFETYAHPGPQAQVHRRGGFRAFLIS
jgi:hypothetical protein